MSAHSLCGLSCRKIHIQNKRWNISASQPYRPPAQNRARPGRAGGLFLSVRAGTAGHNCFASNARKPVDERFSNRALKQIGFKLLPPEQSGRSNSPVLRVCPPTPAGRAAFVAQQGIFPEVTFQCQNALKSFSLMLCRQMFSVQFPWRAGWICNFFVVFATLAVCSAVFLFCRDRG